MTRDGDTVMDRDVDTLMDKDGVLQWPGGTIIARYEDAVMGRGGGYLITKDGDALNEYQGWGCSDDQVLDSTMARDGNAVMSRDGDAMTISDWDPPDGSAEHL